VESGFLHFQLPITTNTTSPSAAAKIKVKLKYYLKLNAMKRINISHIDTIFADGSYPIEFIYFIKTG
jgi:hypothetical protein